MEYTYTLPAGATIRGEKYSYHIEKVLGQGSFGITYLATTRVSIVGALGNIETTVQVAVKEFFMRDINGREGSTVTAGNVEGVFHKYKKKFVEESLRISQLAHNNIIRVLEAFESNNTAYYAMEYCTGGSMDEKIGQHSALTETVAFPYFTQIASALQYMHNNRMLHLDLKPGNIMLRNNEDAVIIDFGLSKQYDENGNPESSTTIGGGTPGYAPTEQSDYQEGKSFPVTMDVYALGATLFKMLSGKRPPKASDVLNEGLPIELLEQRGVSLSTIEAIEKAMSPIRKRRYQSVKEFAQALGCNIPEEVTCEVKGKNTDAPKSAPQQSPVEETVLTHDDTVPGGGDSTQYVGNTFKQNTVGKHNKHNGYEYVDLGLPSGVKWATCNIGAYSPEEYGNYYAWGEISTKSEYTKKNSQTYGENLGDISGNAQYDAARANWGGSWRMPTKAEFDELIEYCTWQWTTQNGVEGYKVTSKTNSNSIFLPAAGWRDGSSQLGAGYCGEYWSSTPDEDDTDRAYYHNFYSGDHSTEWLDRYFGFTVRPVLDDNRASEKTTTTTAAARQQTPTPTPTFTNRGTIAGKEYVDLGLPSGLKWATCNIGAYSPEEYGNYYAWGETSTKSEYTQENSKTFGKNLGDISGNAQYDAAAKNWGGSWRMPRKAEFDELLKHCTWQWTTQNGVKGYKVTGKNGNSIFLPAVGWRFGSSQDGAGEDGHYWSSTPDEYDPLYAYYLNFDSGYHGTLWDYRNYGLTVRPVSE